MQNKVTLNVNKEMLVEGAQTQLEKLEEGPLDWMASKINSHLAKNDAAAAAKKAKALATAEDVPAVVDAEPSGLAGSIGNIMSRRNATDEALAMLDHS